MNTKVINKKNKLDKFFIVISAVVIFFSSNPFYAQATISNGKNASDVIGQYEDETVADPVPAYTKNTAHNGINRLGLNLSTTKINGITLIIIFSFLIQGTTECLYIIQMKIQT